MNDYTLISHWLLTFRLLSCLPQPTGETDSPLARLRPHKSHSRTRDEDRRSKPPFQYDSVKLLTIQNFRPLFLFPLLTPPLLSPLPTAYSAFRHPIFLRWTSIFCIFRPRHVLFIFLYNMNCVCCVSESIFATKPQLNKKKSTLLLTCLFFFFLSFCYANYLLSFTLTFSLKTSTVNHSLIFVITAWPFHSF